MNINATLIEQILFFFGLVCFKMKFVWRPIAKEL
ncbi:F0F1 ATP synthase subunit B, partial [Neisseria sp. P0016.S008]